MSKPTREQIIRDITNRAFEIVPMGEGARRRNEVTIELAYAAGLKAAEAAERALVRLGYTLPPGAVEWVPPLGPSAQPLVGQISALRRLLAEVCHGLDVGDDLRSDAPPPPIDFANDSVEAIREKLMMRAVFGAMRGE